MSSSFSYLAKVPEHREVLAAFRDRLHAACLQALNDYRREQPAETIYAFALLAGQGGNYLGYQLMTEDLLKNVASEYYENGYRHERAKDDEQLQRLCEWMRWQNPDDDWYSDDFDESFALDKDFQKLVYRQKAFGEDAENLVEFCCDDVMATLHDNPAWRAQPELHSIILGVVSDEAEFFTCCVRCNPFRLATQLFDEKFLSEELDRSISQP